MSVKAEYLAVDALAAWLRLKLPAKVTEVNLTRAPVMTAAIAGPYTLPTSGKGLYISLTGVEGPFTHCVLTGGVRTASAVCSDVNSAGGLIPPDLASVDADGRVRLSRDALGAPVSSAQTICIGDDQGEAVNQVFGWDAGGERIINSPLVAPGLRGVMDGWPQQLDVPKTAGGGSPFMVVIGKRQAVPVDSDTRRDEHVVTIELAIFRPAVQQENHRSREHIHACVQCVREVLKTDAGLQLGRASTGDIVKVEVGQTSVEAMRFQPMQKGKPFGPALDSAGMRVYVKTFERPAAT